MSEIAVALKSAYETMVFDARDWSVNPRDAWLYGIICGWGVGISDVARIHGWSADDVQRVIDMHAAVEASQ